MTDMVQLAIAAMANASVYACVAVGFSLIFSASRVVHFGAGHVAMFGGVFFASIGSQGLPGLVVTMAVGAAFGVFVYATVIRFAEWRGISHMGMSLAALAVGLLLDNYVGEWTRNVPQVARPLLSGSVTLAGTSVQKHQLAVVAVTAVALGLLYLFVSRSLLGKAMTAVSNHRDLAAIHGINLWLVIGIAWALGSALMVLGGALLTPMSAMSRGVAFPLAIKGFMASIIGGLGSIGGAVVGAALLAFAEAFFIRYGSPEFANIFVFSALFVILAMRPEGILGAKAVRQA